MYQFAIRAKSGADSLAAAFNEIRQGLQYCGLDIEITSHCRRDGVFLNPLQVMSAAATWEATHDELTIDRRIKFVPLVGKDKDYRDLVAIYKETVDEE